jgi:hypothetical protein
MYIIPIVIGSLIVAFSFVLRWKASAAAEWPTVEGTIIESRVEADAHDAGSSLFIRYRYQVGGVWFESSQLSVKVRSNALSANEELVVRFSVNQQVPVYYNPRVPKEAVLDISPSGSWALLTGFGAAVIGVGLLEYFRLL